MLYKDWGKKLFLISTLGTHIFQLASLEMGLIPLELSLAMGMGLVML
jgi:hypothetical protein